MEEESVTMGYVVDSDHKAIELAEKLIESNRNEISFLRHLLQELEGKLQKREEELSQTRAKVDAKSGEITKLKSVVSKNREEKAMAGAKNIHGAGLVAVVRKRMGKWSRVFLMALFALFLFIAQNTVWPCLMTQYSVAIESDFSIPD